MKTTIPVPPETVLPVTPLLPGAPAYKMAEQVHHQIAQLAFEIFCESGRTEGHALRDWCKAEAQLLEPVTVELEQSKPEVIVHARLRGFAAGDVELSADSRHLFIAAEHTAVRSKPGREAGRPNRVFRIVELPFEIDSRAGTAFLSKEGLDVVLPRIITLHHRQAVAKAA